MRAYVRVRVRAHYAWPFATSGTARRHGWPAPCKGSTQIGRTANAEDFHLSMMKPSAPSEPIVAPALRPITDHHHMADACGKTVCDKSPHAQSTKYKSQTLRGRASNLGRDSRPHREAGAPAALCAAPCAAADGDGTGGGLPTADLRSRKDGVCGCRFQGKDQDQGSIPCA